MKKKYNLSKIMKRAWTLVKTAGQTISSALKQAWKEAKEAMTELKSIDVWDKADEMAELLMESGKYSFAKVNRSEAKHEKKENREEIDRVYYSVSLFKRKGRRSVLNTTIPVGYYDNVTKEYVAKQVGGYDAENVFEWVARHTA